MKITIRNANKDDLDKIADIEKFMYGVTYTIETFKKSYEIFPEGFFVAEDIDIKSEVKSKIVGFVVSEIIKDIQAIPYLHNPSEFHNPKGKILYLSGFGVLPEYQKEKIGTLLYEKLIELCKNSKLELFEVLCNERDSEDQYEMSILKYFGFSEGDVYDWELVPGKIKPHTAWTLRI